MVPLHQTPSSEAEGGGRGVGLSWEMERPVIAFVYPLAQIY